MTEEIERIIFTEAVQDAIALGNANQDPTLPGRMSFCIFSTVVSTLEKQQAYDVLVEYAEMAAKIFEQINQIDFPKRGISSHELSIS